jgi:large subunit ribosomal protein L3
VKKSGVEVLPRYIREFRLDGDRDSNGAAASNGSGEVPEIGAMVDVTLFKEGDHIDVVGVSKGRGFASPIKRWHVRRGPETHGSMYHRRAGSQGASSYPSRTWKNKKGAGHMGAARSTALNVVVVGTDVEKNLLIVRGSVPGHINSFVMVRPTVRAKKAARQIYLLTTAAERQAAAAKKVINPLKASKKGGK